jgi:hypothetical protein
MLEPLKTKRAEYEGVRAGLFEPGSCEMCMSPESCPFIDLYRGL